MPVARDTAPVLLLHGLWMARPAMHWFAARLRARGWAAGTVGYHSIAGGTDATIDALARRMAGAPPAGIVAHSLGGLLALRALDLLGDALPPLRVVCLGTPLCGSGAAKRLAGWPVASLWMGRSAALLQAGCVDWPARHAVGMVAGELPRGLGALVARFDGPHDGTVSVSETRAPALAGHVVVPASHSGLIFSAAALSHVDAFLRDGRFAGAGEAGVAGGQGAAASG